LGHDFEPSAATGWYRVIDAACRGRIFRRAAVHHAVLQCLKICLRFYCSLWVSAAVPHGVTYPSRRGMLGSSVGQMRLNDSRPPATRQIHDWYSKMSYSTLPFTAGFFCFVDERGAKVPAAWRVNLETSFSRSTSAAPEVDGCSAVSRITDSDLPMIAYGHYSN
jgi:hypothetical protein